ncbi:MAG: serine/threonine-protein kinase [Bryobacteraceae bacterium]|nr:serine/threonine-protein kinase [Bryobacteraceae bacterium]
MPTQRSGSVAVSSFPASPEEGRFPAGTVLLERYRIMALLGRGGMGEVYKAYDLKVGQTVALKFLSVAMSGDPGMLARFAGEVRVARQVSHPNVCRVYDIGDFEGQTFLSMEYVDGEDLASLLKRIGRLPADKAVDLARGLCAGVAAAHEKGILHRDLKPANVMIDGRGQVVVMDFGLAALASQVEGNEIRSGTPGYMAPEQLAGTEVTARSDIYSLGLVLFEMFTGRKPFTAQSIDELKEKQRQIADISLSTHVRDLDPAIESVVMRCLAPEPQNRPPSAVSLIAALPGGDPLAAALAAGETPSPELVARTGGQAIEPKAALACLAGVFVVLAAMIPIGANTNLLNFVSSDRSPEALAERAREVLESLGYRDKPADRAYAMEFTQDGLTYLREKRAGLPGRDYLKNSRLSPVYFWYRQSPRVMAPVIQDEFYVRRGNPPAILSGEADVSLDPQGRLLTMRVIAPQFDDSPPAAAPPDWKPLFEAAGLDFSKFRPATPHWTTLNAFEMRAAWLGPLPSSDPRTLGDAEVRVEASAWRNRPNLFQIVRPWVRPERQQQRERSAAENTGVVLNIALFFGVIGTAAFLARHNQRLNRGDRRGAFRVAVSVFFVMLFGWALSASHIFDGRELNMFLTGAQNGLIVAAMCWLFYLALEPYVRRRWPTTLVSWSRLLLGEFRDPLVGRDLLYGILAGSVLSILNRADDIWLWARNETPDGIGRVFEALGGAHLLAARGAFELLSAATSALSSFFILFLLRAWLKKDWLAAAGFVLLIALQNGLMQRADKRWVMVAAVVVIGIVITALVLRLGLLALLTSQAISGFLIALPYTLDMSAWYAYLMWTGLAAVALLSIWSFRVALGKQRLFAGID